MTDAGPFHARPMCRCPLLPVWTDAEEVTVDRPTLESEYPTRTRITLTCSAPGCGITYTYLGATPRKQHTSTDVDLDAAAARSAAEGWGWTFDGVGIDPAARCPRHPVDEHTLDDGD